METISPESLFEALPLDERLIGDLRSDHAGETGAVYIYRGILAATRSSEVATFAAHHLETERHHLAFFDSFLPAPYRSRLTPVWRLAGWLTGAIPAVFGPSAVYLTIAAVERFVDEHYGEQVERIQSNDALGDLRAVLEKFRGDEVDHMQDATGRLAEAPGRVGRAWQRLVGLGSAWGVAVARRV